MKSKRAELRVYYDEVSGFYWNIWKGYLTLCLFSTCKLYTLPYFYHWVTGWVWPSVSYCLLAFAQVSTLDCSPEWEFCPDWLFLDLFWHLNIHWCLLPILFLLLGYMIIMYCLSVLKISKNTIHTFLRKFFFCDRKFERSVQKDLSYSTCLLRIKIDFVNSNNNKGKILKCVLLYIVEIWLGFYFSCSKIDSRPLRISPFRRS